MSCRKLNCLKLLNREKGALFFYIISGKLKTTLTLKLEQIRLDYTSFTETFNIPMVIVLALDSPRCRSSPFCYGYLFMKHSNPFLLISQIYIQLFTVLYYVELFCFDQPLIHYSEIKCTCGYVLALDSSRGCSLPCGCGYLLMKYSSPALIQTEPRSHAEKKKYIKTCCNQNLPAIPLSDDLQG